MLDLIFENQLILISIAASVLPMFMSFLIVFMVVISNGIQVRREKKHEALRQAKILAMKREKLRHQRILELREEEERAEVSLGGVIPAEKAAEEQPKEAEASEEEKPDGAIQDILSSVFADDEAAPRYELLLRDKEPVQMSELQSLAEQVAARLQAQLGGLAS